MLDIRHLGIKLFLLFDRLKKCIIKSFFTTNANDIKKHGKA